MMKFLLISIIWMSAYATDYYIDYATGSDANNGTSTATPWKHAPGMSGCANTCASHTVLQTDRFLFKGGVTWSGTAFPWAWYDDGNATTPNAEGDPGVYLGYDPTWHNGTVVSIKPTTSGSGCTALTVGITGGGGSSAAATANFQSSGYLAGLLQHVTITNAGTGYTSNPTVSFTGSCTVFPTAVADINSPVFDVAGTTWNATNGASAGYGPVHFANVNYLTLDHLEFKNLAVDPDLTGGEISLVTIQNINHGVFKNLYLHKYGPSTIRMTGTPSFSGIAGMTINTGYGGLVSEVSNSFFDNYEMEIFEACGWTNGTPSNFEAPCGSSKSVGGATLFHNNTVHDSRGQVYSPAEPDLDYHDNMIWATTYDCCGQHEDTFYFFGGGKIYNNVLHSAAPLGAANFYIETCRPNPCTIGNETYLFNNVVWGAGRSTEPIGFSSEFWATASVSPAPAMHAYNNTLVARDDVSACIAAGQWYGNSASSTVNFTIKNNHCITDQSAQHWYYSATGSYGTWNGLSDPNGTATKAALDAVNLAMTRATATTQGFTAANYYRPTAADNSTVGAGANLSSLGITALNSDKNGVARGSTWDIGAYEYAAPPPPTTLRGTVRGATIK